MLRVGLDLVQISRIAQSLERLGERFADRLFTAGEIGYAQSSPPLAAERFAARFAAKEAAIKALNLAETGLDWRDIEVVRETSGACALQLHGKARELAERAQVREVSLSMSHEGDYASAVVVVLTA